MSVIGVGIDLVSIPEFTEQLDRPGTRFAEVFTAVERRDAAAGHGPDAMHLAGRWAAKEAVIKAWSGSRFAQVPAIGDVVHRDIWVVTDRWGRPSIRFSEALQEHLGHLRVHLSLTHDGDVAAAVAVLEDPSL